MITMIYWSIQFLFDQLDMLHDTHHELESFILEFVDTFCAPNRSFDGAPAEIESLANRSDRLDKD